MATKNKTCLNCLYEPTWSEPTGREYPRRSGLCKWDGYIPSMPWTYRLDIGSIIRHSDDSGVAISCKTWKPKKQEKNT